MTASPPARTCRLARGCRRGEHRHPPDLRPLAAATLVPTGSYTHPGFGGVGLTEAQARQRNDCGVAIARYEDLVRPVIDAHPEGFCKLIVERHRRYTLGAQVLGRVLGRGDPTASACMAANLRIEQIAELHPGFPTFTEGIMFAAQTIVGPMGIAPTAPTWGGVRADDASLVQAASASK